MTQDHADKLAVQQTRWRRRAVFVALVILLAVPFLVVGGFDLTTRTMFASMESSHRPAHLAERRYDAFQHGYASGVMAVLFGDRLADLSGRLVELFEQDGCPEREHDLINNRQGRAMGLRIHAEEPAGWRARFAEALYADLRDPSTRFSLRYGTDPRVAAICDSN